MEGGGVLSFHDRTVADGGPSTTLTAADYLPGAGAVTFVRDFTDDADIQVLLSNTVTSGPGGVIDNTSLDGGTSSSHGYATRASLPAGAAAVLSRGNPTEIVDFYYGVGSGWVYYSTMPLDYYLAGLGAVAGARHEPRGDCPALG